MDLHNYQWNPTSQWDKKKQNFVTSDGNESDTGLIASGGFAEVFKAKDINFEDRYVALKIYKEALQKDTGGNSRQSRYSLEKEFKMAEELSHPNIVSYKSLHYISSNDHLGRTSRYPVVVMEYATEGTLTEYIQQNQSSSSILDDIIVDIIQGIGNLHQNGIIHRDLKPGNILITKNRQGKLVGKITDFGISKDSLVSSHSTTGGLGTPHYMAPEQHDKKKFGLEGQISCRTDIWAIGVIIYKIFTGTVPFGNDQTDFAEVRSATLQNLPDLSQLPAKYKKLVKACLEKEAKNRPENFGKLLELIGGTTGDTAATVSYPKPGNDDEEKTIVVAKQESGNAVVANEDKEKNSISHKNYILASRIVLVSILIEIFQIALIYHQREMSSITLVVMLALFEFGNMPEWFFHTTALWYIIMLLLINFKLYRGEKWARITYISVSFPRLITQSIVAYLFGFGGNWFILTIQALLFVQLIIESIAIYHCFGLSMNRFRKKIKNEVTF